MRPYVIAWIIQWLVLLLIPIGLVIRYFRRHDDLLLRSRFLRRVGMVFMGGFAFLFTTFLVGETLSDPGGWGAVGLITSWFVPLGLVSAVAWLRPAWGVPLLETLTFAAVSLSLWAALDPDIEQLEDRIGPFVAVTVITVAIALGALGRSRAREAGIMLVITGLVPGVLSSIVGPGPGRGALLIFGVPIVLTGILFLVSDHLATHASPGSKHQRNLDQILSIQEASDPRWSARSK